MNVYPQHLAGAHAAADSLVAVSCFVIAATFAVFALRNRGARLGRIIAVFCFLFAAGGSTHVCEVAGWPAAGLTFKTLTALACAAGAVLGVRCLPAARVMFARVAAFERKADARLGLLKADPRYDTPEDREWQHTLSEIKDLARLAREAVGPEEV